MNFNKLNRSDPGNGKTAGKREKEKREKHALEGGLNKYHCAGANGHRQFSFGLSYETWKLLLHSEPDRHWPWLSFGSLGIRVNKVIGS
jgi:hypothetical protein